jgi:Ca-activated chloride channel family protein
VRLRFHDRLTYDDGGYEWIFPSVVLPRYTPKSEGEAGGPGGAPAPFPGSPILPDGSRDGHTIAISVEIDAGKIDGIVSPSHEIAIEQRRGGRALVTLKETDAIPNRDFVLRYRVAGVQPRAAAFTYRAPSDGGARARPGTVLLTLTPQLEAPPELVHPRELLFVFDRSGSMGGDAIVQARNALRACLRALNAGDSFNIFPFDDRAEQFAPVAQPFTQEAVDRADAFIEGINARGGTEILRALQLALSQPVERERLRVVVFLTDGAVSNEDQVLRELRRSLGAARVFAFGVGTAVNRFLLDKLAEVGRGSVEYIFPGQAIEDAVQRFQNRAAYPLLVDLQLDWGGARVTDAYPAPLPDLYAGQPLSVLARFHSSGPTEVTFSGRSKRGPYRQTLSVEWPQATPDLVGSAWEALPQVWARSRIDWLLGQQRDAAGRGEAQVREEALSLALEQRLLSPYTSFVAVEQRRDEHGLREAAEAVVVPIHLPQGTRREAFEARQPGPQVLYSVMPASFSPSPQRAAGSHGGQARGGRGLLGRLGEAVQSAFAPDAPQPADAGPPPPPILSAAPQAEMAAAPRHVLDDTERAAAALRYLARTQSVDGSWGDSATATALALLAFLNAGHSDRAGGFRPQLSRAAAWLTARAKSGNPALAWALAELAAATGAPAHSAARDTALAALPAAGDATDRACAAQARRAAGQPAPREPLADAPRGDPTDERAALEALLLALGGLQAAEATARLLAALQSERGDTSGAVTPRGASAGKPYPPIFAATALGALVWGREGGVLWSR